MPNLDKWGCRFTNESSELVFIRKSLGEDFKTENKLLWCVKNVGQALLESSFSIFRTWTNSFCVFPIQPSFNILMRSNPSLSTVIYKINKNYLYQFERITSWLIGKAAFVKYFDFLWPALGCGEIAWQDIFFCGKLEIKAQPEFFELCLWGCHSK